MGLEFSTGIFGQAKIEGAGNAAALEHPGGRDRFHQALAHPRQTPAEGPYGPANPSHRSTLRCGVFSGGFRHLVAQAGRKASEGY
jgi:hypothetical protein